MKSFIFLFFIISSVLYAQVNEDANLSNKIQIEQDEKQKQIEIELEVQNKKEKLNAYRDELKNLQEEISNEKVWNKSYASYLTSLEVRESLEKITERIKYLTRKKKSISENDELSGLISKEKILASEIEKLKQKGSAPFSKLLTPPNIDDIPSVTNPFDIFTGISRTKTLDIDFTDYKKRKEQLNGLIRLLRKELQIYKEITLLDTEKKYEEIVAAKEKQLEIFQTALDTITVTSKVYQKRLEIAELNINKGVKEQAYRLMKIGIIIFVVFILYVKFFS